MQSFLTALIECSISMSALILGFIALTPLLAKRYASKWIYYVWLVIVVGLIVPFRFHPDTALIQVSAAPSYIQQIMLGNTGNVVETAIQTSPTNQGFPAISWYQLAGCLWIAGAIAFLVHHGLRHYRFIGMVKRWGEQANDPQMLKVLQKIKNDMGIAKQVRLQICCCVSSPMIIGFLNPVILLPQSDFSADELPYIFRHELAHFKRKDLWYKSLVLLATAIHWFNPVVYLMAKAIASQCELSCDAEVVNEIGMDGRQWYSEIIIGVIKNQSRVQTAFSTNFYGGKKDMKRRIFSIMDTKRKRTGMTILCLILIGTMGIGMTFAVNKGTTPSAYSTNTPMLSKEQEKVNQQNREALAKAYAVYMKYGLTYDQKTDNFYYDGKLVRYFSDKLDAEGNYNAFTRGNGVIDLVAIRNVNYELTGITSVSQKEYDKHTESIKRVQAANMQGGEAQENRNGNINHENGLSGTEKAGETGNTVNSSTFAYSAGDPNYVDDSLNAYFDYGVSYDKANKQWIFNNKIIHYFSDGYNVTYWNNSENAINNGVSLKVIRTSDGRIDKLVEIARTELN